MLNVCIILSETQKDIRYIYLCYKYSLKHRMILLNAVLFVSFSSSLCHNVVIEEISETFVESPENVLTKDTIEQFVDKSLKDLNLTSICPTNGTSTGEEEDNGFVAAFSKSTETNPVYFKLYFSILHICDPCF